MSNKFIFRFVVKMEKNKSLRNLNTFGIDVTAKYFVSISSVEELKELSNTHTFNEEYLLILGGGSNILLTKDFHGIVLKNNIMGIKVVEETENDVLIEIGAGENWHQLVLFCIKNNFGGIENLSLIPGNVGAAPMQNIGAYGVELKDTFVFLEAFNIEKKQIENFNSKDCRFGYRESIFKKELKNKYIITKVALKLTKPPHKLNTNYGDIQKELERLNISVPTIKDVSDTVIKIRRSKLPDPKEIGNSGSFFKNPIINKSDFEQLYLKYPTIAHYKVDDNSVKIAAGWLIEHAGWKGKTILSYGVHKKQALVLVNYGGSSGGDIYKLSLAIIDDIKEKFGIELEREVNVI